jgi:hypothetical protein
MLPTLGALILMAFAGTISAAICTFFIGICGSPGALLYSRSPRFGLALCVVGQCYAVFAFSAVVYGAMQHFFGGSAFYGAVLWPAAWLICQMPASFALHDAATRPTRIIPPDTAIALTVWLEPLALPLFWFQPSLLRPWSWMPFV